MYLELSLPSGSALAKNVKDEGGPITQANFAVKHALQSPLLARREFVIKNHGFNAQLRNSCLQLFHFATANVSTWRCALQLLICLAHDLQPLARLRTARLVSVTEWRVARAYTVSGQMSPHLQARCGGQVSKLNQRFLDRVAILALIAFLMDSH